MSNNSEQIEIEEDCKSKRQLHSLKQTPHKHNTIQQVKKESNSYCAKSSNQPKLFSNHDFKRQLIKNRKRNEENNEKEANQEQPIHYRNAAFKNFLNMLNNKFHGRKSSLNEQDFVPINISAVRNTSTSNVKGNASFHRNQLSMDAESKRNKFYNFQTAGKAFDYNLESKRKMNSIVFSSDESVTQDNHKLSQWQKEQIIKCMLKEKKISQDILSKHMKSLSIDLREEEKVSKLAKLILDNYELVVETNSVQNVESSQNLCQQRPITHGLHFLKGICETKTLNTCRKSYNEIHAVLPVPSVEGNDKKAVDTSETSPRQFGKLMKLRNRQAKSHKLAKGQLNNHPTENYCKNILDCHMNELILLINQFTSLTSRSKDRNYDIKAINTVIKKFRFKKTMFSEEDFKSREKLTQYKESILRLLYYKINKENEIKSLNLNKSFTPSMKYFIGQGNNSELVKSIMKDRWWWTTAADVNEANFVWTQWRKKSFISDLKCSKSSEVNSLSAIPIKLCNHLEGDNSLGQKKSMFINLLRYYNLLGKDVFSIIPLTFHIMKGITDENYAKFKNYFNNLSTEVGDDKLSLIKNVWIAKPGENTNRGNGILITSDISEIERYIQESPHSCIIQKYIERPFLFDHRKFDIRCFGLITSINGFIKGYFIEKDICEPLQRNILYIHLMNSVHLTNEAIQIKYEDFGKYEAGNKVIIFLIKKMLDFI